MSTPALLSLFHWRPVSLSADSQVGRQKNQKKPTSISENDIRSF